MYVIIGCTASGKAALGVELARRCGGRILSIDSMKIYRGMDIGTAKASSAVRAEIPHHAVDIVDPWQAFSVAQYLEIADRTVETVAPHAPLLAVGGTGLYLKALVEGMFEGPGRDPAIREELHARAEREGTAALHADLARVDPAAAGWIHPNDLRRIVRALEVHRQTGTPISELQRQWDQGRSRHDFRILWLRRSREDTNHRINRRVHRMIDEGLVDEVARLLADPRGLSTQAAAALGYAEVIRHLRGDWPLAEAVEQIKINTRQFAKNQRTWFRHFAARGARALDVAPDATVEGVADAAAELLELALAARPRERQP